MSPSGYERGGRLGRVLLPYATAFRAVSGQRIDELPYLILVGTHHKTGTVWLKNVFGKISRELGLQFYSGCQSELPEDADVFFENHSRFDLACLRGEFRGLHMIRDPRDILVSGCFYHVKSLEPWLHVGRSEFGGATYQEKLRSFASLEDRLRFEMEGVAADTIREMASWDYEQPEFLEVRYEDLIFDEDLHLFHEIFTHLGIPGRSIPCALRVAHENSLFSGRVRDAGHIRSGAASQWTEHLSAANRRRFVELFPDLLVRLGYESDDSWVEGSSN